MAISLDTLIIDLRRSYADDLPDAEQALTADQLRRSLMRAVITVNRDFARAYAIEAEVLTPDPPANDREMLLLAAMVSVSEMMLARYARYPSVKSGDKSVSRDGQVDAWSRLHARYSEQYRDSVASYSANRRDNVDPLLYG